MLYPAGKQPAAFFATCAQLLPNDVRVTVEQSLPGNLSIEDWATLRQVLFDMPRTMSDLSHCRIPLRHMTEEVKVQRLGRLGANFGNHVAQLRGSQRGTRKRAEPARPANCYRHVETYVRPPPIGASLWIGMLRTTPC